MGSCGSAAQQERPRAIGEPKSREIVQPKAPSENPSKSREVVFEAEPSSPLSPKTWWLRHDRALEKIVATANDRLQKSTQAQKSTEDEGAIDFAKASVVELKQGLNELSSIGVKQRTKKGRGAKHRFSDGLKDVELDKGVCDFFSKASCVRDVIQTVGSALEPFAEEYTVCKACGNGLRAANKGKHKLKCRKAESPELVEYLPMTAEWAVAEAKKKAEEFCYLAMYSLETPLCYGINAAMRNAAFRDEWEGYTAAKDFAYCIHKQLQALPEFKGTVYRAVDIRVSDGLYAEGAVVTMPTPTSASRNPQVIKDFLGGHSESNKATGTILIFRVRTGRAVDEFSRYPAEEEVIIPTNTQFRIHGRPDHGVTSLLECALEADLDDVAIVELQEVDLTHWGNFRHALTDTEIERNAALLEAIHESRLPEQQLIHHPVTLHTIQINFPLMHVIPRFAGHTLLEHAAKEQANEQVLSLCMTGMSSANPEHMKILNETLDFCVAEAVNGHQTGNLGLLLSKGAQVGEISPERRTSVLGIASSRCSPEIMRSVHAALGDTFWEAADVWEKEGHTVLHEAAGLGRVATLRELLIEVKEGRMSIDVRNADGETPCFAAAREGCLEALRILVNEGGADVKATNSKGEGLCHVAARGHKKVLQYLIKECGADMNCRDVCGATPLLMAVVDGRGHPKCVEVLLRAGADDKLEGSFSWVGGSPTTLPLIAAAGSGHTEAVRVLLEFKHVSPDVTRKDGLSGLILAAQGAHFRVVRILLEAGADVNLEKGDSGETACHAAAWSGHALVLRLLCEHGADVNKTDKSGKSAVHYAAQEGHPDCIIVLARHGAELDRADKNGMTPAHCAAKGGRIEALRALLESGAGVNHADIQGKTAAHWAAKQGHDHCVSHLHEAGANMEHKDVKGRTPLDIVQLKNEEKAPDFVPHPSRRLSLDAEDTDLGARVM
eukprot:Hpha_TRINITY_DN4250_c0_g1::TRINITY_DN4250_c0_g1_i1::g.186734::m.186734